MNVLANKDRDWTMLWPMFVFMGEYIFLVLFASLQFVLHQLDQTIYLKKQTNGTFECTVAASHYGTVTKVNDWD